MTLNDLIEELENAREEKGGESEVSISFQKKSNSSGDSELLWGNILDVVYTKDSDKNHIGIWAMEPEDFEK
jgi:hypothetical protein